MGWEAAEEGPEDEEQDYDYWDDEGRDSRVRDWILEGKGVPKEEVQRAMREQVEAMGYEDMVEVYMDMFDDETDFMEFTLVVAKITGRFEPG